MKDAAQDVVRRFDATGAARQLANSIRRLAKVLKGRDPSPSASSAP